ncbi:unnamed protein product [Prunus armeniaca]
MAEEASALEKELDKRNTNKYCAFHETYGHEMVNCRAWKMHLEELVGGGPPNLVRFCFDVLAGEDALGLMDKAVGS